MLEILKRIKQLEDKIKQQEHISLEMLELLQILKLIVRELE